ncbi:MAG: lactonase family protein [Verrucomicrobia bacterium]|nr:lactonase family protein [Verrucomicrobiota bacterium]
MGTYNIAKGPKEEHPGIFIFRFDPCTGRLTATGNIQNVANPSFLCTSKCRNFLYAVNELAEFNGQAGGGVTAFAINRQTGELTALNSQSTAGAHPCYVSIDQTGQWLAVSNYTGGSLALFPLQNYGHIGPLCAFEQHKGHGIAPQQKTAHVHSAIMEPSNRYLLVADLGLDKIAIYTLDHKSGTLKPHEPLGVSLKPGAGPRHMVFHPNGRFFYVVNELDSTVTVFACIGKEGALEQIQMLPTLPAGFAGFNACADIHVAASGKFLYASNRGHDSVAIFSIDHHTGMLSSTGHVSTQGRNPRNFAIDPAGNFLLVANQDSHTLVTFKIDPAMGLLSPTTQTIQVPSPVCVLFVEQSL